MVERLFSSRALYRTLGLFFDFPHEPLNPRLIARYTRTDIKTVVIVLRKLEGMGLVRSRPADKCRVYELDGGHPLFEELGWVFCKTTGERERLWRSQSLGIWNGASEVPTSVESTDVKEAVPDSASTSREKGCGWKDGHDGCGS